MEDEDQAIKRRRLNRLRQQRWRTRQCEETLERLRRENAQRVYKRRERETEQQREARRAACALAQAVRRQKETNEQKQARLAAIALSQAKRRQNETQEQREARRAAMAFYQANRRQEQTQTRREVIIHSQAEVNEQDEPIEPAEHLLKSEPSNQSNISIATNEFIFNGNNVKEEWLTSSLPIKTEIECEPFLLSTDANIKDVPEALVHLGRVKSEDTSCFGLP